MGGIAAAGKHEGEGINRCGKVKKSESGGREVELSQKCKKGNTFDVGQNGSQDAAGKGA